MIHDVSEMEIIGVGYHPKVRALCQRLDERIRKYGSWGEDRVPGTNKIPHVNLRAYCLAQGGMKGFVGQESRLVLPGHAVAGECPRKNVALHACGSSHPLMEVFPVKVQQDLPHVQQ